MLVRRIRHWHGLRRVHDGPRLIGRRRRRAAIGRHRLTLHPATRGGRLRRQNGSTEYGDGAGVRTRIARLRTAAVALTTIEPRVITTTMAPGRSEADCQHNGRTTCAEHGSFLLLE